MTLAELTTAMLSDLRLEVAKAYKALDATGWGFFGDKDTVKSTLDSIVLRLRWLGGEGRDLVLAGTLDFAAWRDQVQREWKLVAQALGYTHEWRFSTVAPDVAKQVATTVVQATAIGGSLFVVALAALVVLYVVASGKAARA